MTYSGSLFFNTIPAKITESPSLNVFKINLRSNLFYLKYVNHCEARPSVIKGNLTHLTNIVIFIYSQRKYL